jgi:hypothetical protein
MTIKAKLILYVLFFLLTVPPLSFSEPNPDSISKATKSTQQKPAAKMPFIVAEKPAVKTDQQAPLPNQTKRNVETSDEKIATFTLCLVIVACIQAFIFALQLIAMVIQAKRLKETVKATEKAAKAAEASTGAVVRMELPIIRAIPGDLIFTDKLITGDETYGGSVTNGLPSKYSGFGSIGFTNYGRTPAFPERLSAGWMVASGLPDKPTYIKSSVLGRTEVIEPRKTFTADTHYGIELTDDELRTTKEGSAWLWFYGCLYYRDFMNIGREFRFCWRWANHSPKGHKPFFSFSSDGEPPEDYIKSA